MDIIIATVFKKNQAANLTHKVHKCMYCSLIFFTLIDFQNYLLLY